MKDESYIIPISLMVIGVSILLIATSYVLELIGLFIESIGAWILIDLKIRKPINIFANKIVKFINGSEFIKGKNNEHRNS